MSRRTVRALWLAASMVVFVAFVGHDLLALAGWAVAP